MPSDTKPLVMLVGITGYTGQRVSAIIRSARWRSLSPKKCMIQVLLSYLEIFRLMECETLTTLLAGVEVLIMTVLAFVDQRPVLLAAKEAGVKRVVPSEFGPSIPRGVSSMLICHAYTSYPTLATLFAHHSRSPRTLRQLTRTQQEIWMFSERLTAEDVKNRHRDPDLASKAFTSTHNSPSLAQLTARVLYPDYEALPLEELARAFYEKPLVYILPTLS
ncbi:NAD(P)-binding protein [Mycena floridula]|nr:NAD(P)-binding protein [Mycena floridula]